VVDGTGSGALDGEVCAVQVVPVIDEVERHARRREHLKLRGGAPTQRRGSMQHVDEAGGAAVHFVAQVVQDLAWAGC
jgi:hypothetical protein